MYTLQAPHNISCTILQSRNVLLRKSDTPYAGMIIYQGRPLYDTNRRQYQTSAECYIWVVDHSKT